MTTLIKLGGSLVTNKRKPKSFHAPAVREIARQLNAVRKSKPERRLIVGHGSGSFGHAEAAKHDTALGVRTREQWHGFAQVGAVAAELSLLILAEFLSLGIPTMRFQPSSMLRVCNRHILDMDVSLLLTALDRGLLPLVHGDVALDEANGGAIVSTESLFSVFRARNACRPNCPAR